MGPIETKGIILGLGVAAGALCLFLGYRLYERGVIEKGQLAAQGHGMKLTLKDYSPGVVFALFGAAIIVFCVTRTLASNTKMTTTYQTAVQTGHAETATTVAAAPENAMTAQAHPPVQPAVTTVTEAAAAASGAMSSSPPTKK